jgi:transcriptional regulator with XRE-family HTH domain
MTQEQLAERSELSVDTVRRVERGAFSPSLETIAKLAAGLDISLPILLGQVSSAYAAHAAELCDYLSRRSQREVRIAQQVLQSLCDALMSEG